MKWLDGITNSMDLNLSKLWSEGPGTRGALWASVSDWIRLSTEEKENVRYCYPDSTFISQELLMDFACDTTNQWTKEPFKLQPC